MLRPRLKIIKIGGADERTAFVEELMKYMKIDSAGACLHNIDFDQPKLRQSHGDKIIEKVKKILAEKFFIQNFS